MRIRRIDSGKIEKTVKELCKKANTILRPDVLKALTDCYNEEKKNSIAREMMEILMENARIARRKNLAICQDTGMVTCFVELGDRVIITGDSLERAINKGIEKAYRECYFRRSVVSDPLIRKNTGTNTPAIIHVDIVRGEKIKLSVMPKGFGSENKGRVVMLNPTSTSREIVDFCVDTVRKAGPDACPPYVLGIGIGGTMEACAFLAKKALLRPIGKHNPKAHIARMEREIKQKINALNIGVMGVGGRSTVMAVHIESAPTHIAGLPVAVNVSCHALRSASAII